MCSGEIHIFPDHFKAMILHVNLLWFEKKSLDRTKQIPGKGEFPPPPEALQLKVGPWVAVLLGYVRLRLWNNVFVGRGNLPGSTLCTVDAHAARPTHKRTMREKHRMLQLEWEERKAASSGSPPPRYLFLTFDPNRGSKQFMKRVSPLLFCPYDNTLRKEWPLYPILWCSLNRI